MIRHNKHTIRRLQRRVQVENARHCQAIVVESWHIRIVVRYARAFLLQKVNYIKSRGLA
jgi:hypothetical protein